MTIVIFSGGDVVIATTTTSATSTAAVAALASNGGGGDSVQHRRSVESGLAAIMMGYVLVFLVCHFPRIMLSILELQNIR